MDWRDPPAEIEADWQRAAGAAFEGVRPGRCPTEDGGVLRFFFNRAEGTTTADEPRSRGGFWIWCPVCRSYEHGSCRVPEWWRDVETPLDELMHDPGWLEEHWDEDWLQRQPLR